MRRTLILAVAAYAAARLFAAGNVTLLFDNDAHCAMEGYGAMARLRDSLLRRGEQVMTVSCGDFLTGNAYGLLSRGVWPVEAMQTAGYDFIALGNHEFDFGQERLLELSRQHTGRVVCCNYLRLPDSVPVFPAFALRKYEDLTIGLVGVITPSAAESSAPGYFQCPAACFDGTSTLKLTQQAVDAARRAGADFVVVLSHLGDRNDPALTSRQLIAATHGVDLVLDGHDHRVLRGLRLSDRQGRKVPLVSTGASFRRIGQVTLKKGERPAVRLVTTKRVKGRPTATDTLLSVLHARHDSLTALPIGYINPTPLRQGLRQKERRRETALGDLCADALRTAGGANIGLMNGGGIRGGLPKGELTEGNLLDLLPFGNRISVVEISGETLLRELERGLRRLPRPSGGFPQVSGLIAEVDVRPVPHIRQARVWNRHTGDYEPVHPDSVYTVTASDYLLKQGGNGYDFTPRRFIEESFMTETEALRAYLTGKGADAAPPAGKRWRIHRR